MPMRWGMVLALLAGCGRFGFDPLGNGGTPGDDDVDSGPGSDGNPTDGVGSSSHYIIGGTASNAGTATSISIPTAPLADTNMVIVVAIHWKSGTSSVATVQDSFGNGFSMLGSMTRYNASSQVMWFKRVTAGTTINVLFAQPTPAIDVQWAAYREIDQTSPTSFNASNVGTSATASAGKFTLQTDTVLVSSTGSLAVDASAGAGFTGRQKANGGVLADAEVASGTLNATATLSSSSDWIIQLVALRPL